MDNLVLQDILFHLDIKLMTHKIDKWSIFYISYTELNIKIVLKIQNIHSYLMRKKKKREIRNFLNLHMKALQTSSFP